MQILIKNEINRFLSKKKNFLIIGALILAGFGFHQLVSKQEIIIRALGFALIQFNGAIAFVFGLIINFIIYNAVNTKNVISREQIYTIGINKYLVPTFFIVATFLLGVVIIAYPVYMMENVVNVKGLITIGECLLMSNLVVYVATRNMISFLFSAAFLYGCWHYYTNSTLYYVLWGVLIVLVLLATYFEEKLALQNKFSFNLSFLMVNKFFESQLYMMRKEKAVKWLWLFLISAIYCSLPNQFHIHFKYTIITNTIIEDIVLMVSFFVCMFKGLLFTRETNLYYQIENNLVYFYYILMNTVLILLIVFGSSIGDNWGNVKNIIDSSVANVSFVSIVLLLSVIVRKRTAMWNIIGFVGTLVLSSLLSGYVKSTTTQLVIYIIIIVVSLVIEYVNSRRSLKKLY